MAEDDHPMVLAHVGLYDWGPAPLSIGWTKSDQLNRGVVGKLVALKTEAMLHLLEVSGIFATRMRDAAAIELGIRPMRPNHFQTWKEIKIVDLEVRDRLASGKWPNLCQGPALALSLIGSIAVDPIIKVVQEEDWLAKAQLFWALGVIEDKRALPVLRKSLSFRRRFHLGSREVRQAARSAMARIAKI